LGVSEVSQTLSELADSLSGGKGGEELCEEAMLAVICHSAVRAGQTLSHDEMRDLIRQLERTSLPHSCPHGRPIFLHLSTDRLAHAFGRT
jgi:DNA mismatch repair protein MutL